MSARLLIYDHARPRLGPLPPPRNRGLPRLRIMLRKSGKPDLRWGRVGEGGPTFGDGGAAISRPPPPAPPHKGHKGQGSRSSLLLPHGPQ
jgi:hypothetical protein